jgi:hypothetical protein
MNTGTIWSGVRIWDSYPLDIQKDAESNKCVSFDDEKAHREQPSNCICQTAILNGQQDLSFKKIDSNPLKNLDKIREELKRTLQQARRDHPFCLSYEDLKEYYCLGLFGQWEDLLLIVKLCHPLDWIDFWLFLKQKFPNLIDLEKPRLLLLEGLLYLFQLEDSTPCRFYEKTFAALHRKSSAQIYYIDCLAATVFGTTRRREALSNSLYCSRTTATVSTFKTHFDRACLFLNGRQAICEAITRYLQKNPDDSANQELNSILKEWLPKGWTSGNQAKIYQLNFEQFQLLVSCFSFLGNYYDEVYQELINFTSLEICFKHVKTLKHRNDANPVVNALKGRLHYRMYPFKDLNDLTEDQAADLADLLAREPLYYYNQDFPDVWHQICIDLDHAKRSFFKDNLTKALIKIVLEDPYINFKLLDTLKKLKLIRADTPYLPSAMQDFGVVVE